MPYVVLIHATFDTKSDADFIYDQAKQVAIRTPGPVAGFTAGGNVAAILIEAGSSEKPLGRVGGQ
jgi:hypothetical protein